MELIERPRKLKVELTVEDIHIFYALMGKTTFDEYQEKHSKLLNKDIKMADNGTYSQLFKDVSDIIETINS